MTLEQLDNGVPKEVQEKEPLKKVVFFYVFFYNSRDEEGMEIWERLFKSFEETVNFRTLSLPTSGPVTLWVYENGNIWSYRGQTRVGEEVDRLISRYKPKEE